MKENIHAYRRFARFPMVQSECEESKKSIQRSDPKLLIGRMKIFFIRKPAFSVEYKVGKVSNVWVWFQPGMAWSIALLGKL